MNINEFTEKVKDQFIDGPQISLTPDSNFREVGSWDSLTGMAVLVMIQDEYGVDMPDTALRACSTIRDIFNYVQEKKG